MPRHKMVVIEQMRVTIDGPYAIREDPSCIGYVIAIVCSILAAALFALPDEPLQRSSDPQPAIESNAAPDTAPDAIPAPRREECCRNPECPAMSYHRVCCTCHEDPGGGGDPPTCDCEGDGAEVSGNVGTCADADGSYVHAPLSSFETDDFCFYAFEFEGDKTNVEPFVYVWIAKQDFTLTGLTDGSGTGDDVKEVSAGEVVVELYIEDSDDSTNWTKWNEKTTDLTCADGVLSGSHTFVDSPILTGDDPPCDSGSPTASFTTSLP